MHARMNAKFVKENQLLKIKLLLLFLKFRSLFLGNFTINVNTAINSIDKPLA
jgi:hypothetical protein